jgi:hypothetical protein
MQQPLLARPGVGCCTRRTFSAMTCSLGMLPWVGRSLAADEVSGLPAAVAGIAIPRSRIAIRAVKFSRASCPAFLFNHCMRTFVFGALALQKQNLSYDADQAFVAAALHDLGLLPAFETKGQSFEIDGADAAQKFAHDAGLNTTGANIVWHGVALHDARFAITRRAGPEAMLVALGAASDVDGPDLNADSEKQQMAEVIAAFPRIQFKARFTQLLIDHCQRKPLSQRGTWLEGLCREQVPSAWSNTVEQEIAAAPFAE